MENDEKPTPETQPEVQLPVEEADTTNERPSEHEEVVKHEPMAGQGAHGSRLERLKSWYLQHKKLSIPLTVVLLLVLLAAIPQTRYALAGTVMSKDLAVVVKDSTAGTPVSGAKVSVGSVSAETDSSGKATLHSLKVGSKTLVITKKYYTDRKASVVVPILKAKNIPEIKLVATGRQVKIKVTDFVNGNGLADVSINLAGSISKTDKNGEALVVVPTGASTQTAKLSLDGYNSQDATVKVSDSSIQQNDFKLVASGKVYFLSKLSGKIDVVKTNLDGSERETVLAGTGKEDDTNTVLLASRDWKYLALLSARDTGQPKLYVISTDDDKLLAMDQGDANFTPVGWSNHYFVYTVARNGYNNWQPNAFSIKSYNADTGQLLTLANNNATGTSNADAQYEAIFDTLFMGNDVVYTRTWYKYPGYLQVEGKQDVLAAIHPDGTNSRQIKTVDANTSYISNVKLNKPGELDFGVYSNNSSNATYFVLDKNGNLKQSTTLTDSDLFSETTTYLSSPSGEQTFWQDERDGKNTLFIGDQDGGNAKQIATLSDYSTYGWYTDNYLLVSKNSSELYIIPKSGLKDNSKALKVSDYHKPSHNFYGYGGGYGGL